MNEAAKNDNNANNEQEAKEKFENMYDKYQNKNQNEIQNELIRMVAENKANGNLTNDDLDNFYNSMSGMLDKQQKENLKNLIEELKNDSH